MNNPRTKAEAMTRRYGRGGWEMKGLRYIAGLCAYSVSDIHGWYHSQCSRKAVAGPDNLYCKQHAKMVAPEIERSEDHAK